MTYNCLGCLVQLLGFVSCKAGPFPCTMILLVPQSVQPVLSVRQELTGIDPPYEPSNPAYLSSSSSAHNSVVLTRAALIGGLEQCMAYCHHCILPCFFVAKGHEQKMWLLISSVPHLAHIALHPILLLVFGPMLTLPLPILLMECLF